MVNAGVTLNILLSISSPFGLFLLFGSAKVMITITAIIIRNTHDILFKKGIGSIVPRVNVGRNLKKVDNGIVNKEAVSAAREVVLFQKKPSKKMAKTPGEMKPTYS